MWKTDNLPSESWARTRRDTIRYAYLYEIALKFNVVWKFKGKRLLLDKVKRKALLLILKYQWNFS